MRVWIAVAALLSVLSGTPAQAQTTSEPVVTRTFVKLTNNANALIAGPAAPDPKRARIAVLLTHPDHLNTFSLSGRPERASIGADPPGLGEFRPCKPEYGDTAAHAFDHVDGWLMKAGRF